MACRYIASTCIQECSSSILGGRNNLLDMACIYIVGEEGGEREEEERTMLEFRIQGSGCQVQV